VADIEESPPESPREASFLSNTPTLPPIKAYSFDGKEVVIKRKPIRIKEKTDVSKGGGMYPVSRLNGIFDRRHHPVVMLRTPFQTS
jgi:hypothetical protein